MPSLDNTKEGISLIICCYNSKDRLKETLTHIINQKDHEHFSVELVVVDNNSTDNTAQFTSNFLKNKKDDVFFDWKIVSEPKPGLMNARYKGIESSKYDLLIFCDDDNWLDSYYLDKSLKIMSENTNIGALGGKGKAVCEIKEPKWFAEKQNSYACGEQATKTGYVNNRGYLWGAGLVTRKSIFNELKQKNFKSFLIGRNGNSLGSGDDSEICKWILLLGYDLYYDSSLQFSHYITKNRLTKDYFVKMEKGFKEASPFLSKYNYLIRLKKSNKSIFLKFTTLLKSILINKVFNLTSKNDLVFLKVYFRFIK